MRQQRALEGRVRSLAAPARTDLEAREEEQKGERREHDAQEEHDYTGTT